MDGQLYCPVYSKHLAATKTFAKLSQSTAISKSTKLHWEKLSLVRDSSLNATQKNSPRVAATLKNHKHQTNKQTNNHELKHLLIDLTFFGMAVGSFLGSYVMVLYRFHVDLL